MTEETEPKPLRLDYKPAPMRKFYIVYIALFIVFLLVCVWVAIMGPGIKTIYTDRIIPISQLSDKQLDESMGKPDAIIPSESLKDVNLPPGMQCGGYSDSKKERLIIICR